MDQPQTGFNTSVASIAATARRPHKTAEITADAIGTSRSKVERARAVLAVSEEAAAVRRGEKTIHQAAQDAKARHLPVAKNSLAGSKRRHRSTAAMMIDEDALEEGHRSLLLLSALSARDPDESRRTLYRSAAGMVRRALKKTSL